MKQSIYGLVIYVFLILPPVANLMESIMIIHMHMQMPLLVFAGWLIAHYWRMTYPHFFSHWNPNGLPGILLFVFIWVYWMIPRTMDEALMNYGVEWFKFISLPLAGLALRDSWGKIGSVGKLFILYSMTLLFIGLGWLYISAPMQLCNNYLLIEQVTLGWGFLTTAICMMAYLVYDLFADKTTYE